MAEENQESKQIDDELEKRKWMVRPCDTYKDEYTDCKAIKSRFHQYFVFGETTDCNQWKTDLNNCERWIEDQNKKALKELIESEEKRRTIRLKAHYQNDTWKKRSTPPPDWEKPLPAWLEEENKNTFLEIKAQEIRQNGKIVEGDRSLCTIL